MLLASVDRTPLPIVISAEWQRRAWNPVSCATAAADLKRGHVARHGVSVVEVLERVWNGKMPNFSREQRLAFAVGIPVAALLLFLWFRRRRGSFNATDDANEAVEENEFASGCETTIEVKMPQTAVGAVIGKGGANVKRIRKETGVRLDMVDEKDNVQATQGTRTMLVRGEREKAKRAELMLLKIIQEQPVILTEEVFVPQSACGRIIGKGGQNIRDIGRVSGNVPINSKSHIPSPPRYTPSI